MKRWADSRGVLAACLILAIVPLLAGPGGLPPPSTGLPAHAPAPLIGMGLAMGGIVMAVALFVWRFARRG